MNERDQAGDPASRPLSDTWEMPEAMRPRPEPPPRRELKNPFASAPTGRKRKARRQPPQEAPLRSPPPPAAPPAEPPPLAQIPLDSEEESGELDPPAASPAPDPQADEGRFELLEQLGQGGMGVVYRARERASGREVALKMIADAEGSVRRERFRREGEVTASLQHHGIVRVYSTGSYKGMPYLAYELVEGHRTLKEALPDLSLTRRLEILRDAAHAVGFAHDRGVIHRDLKPANLLLDAEGNLRVADFGLALRDEAERVTQSGVGVGTLGYMAPEQLRRRSQVGPPADVWALGVILYQALTDEHPFLGGSPQEIVARITAAVRHPPRERRPELPAELDAVCQRALGPDPAERYRDGNELGEDLARYLRGEPVLARPPRLFARWLRLAPWLLGPLATAALAVFALSFRPDSTQPSPPLPEGSRPPAVPSPEDPPATPSSLSQLDLETLLRRATAGEPAAQVELARRYYEGEGTPVLRAEARRWYGRAADAGHTGAMVRHGDMLSSGEGGDVDASAAVERYRAAHVAGDPNGSFGLATMLLDGRGITGNPGYAEPLLRLAADQGHPRAQQLLDRLQERRRAQRAGIRR